MVGVYHDLDEAIARSFHPDAGWLVCLTCLGVRREHPLDAHDHCHCTRHTVPAPDHVEARLPSKSLCIVCSVGLAGGPTRWAWLACRDCRTMDARIAELLGLRRTGLPLGRHSIMNGAAVRIADGYDPEQAQRLASSLNQMGRLHDVGRAKAHALADRHFPGQNGHIPLWRWQESTPPGPQTSLTALKALLGDAVPDRVFEAAAYSLTPTSYPD